MVTLKEDITSPEAVDVHYQTLEDLKSGDNTEKKVVVHDDNPDQMELDNFSQNDADKTPDIDPDYHEDLPVPTMEPEDPTSSELPAPVVALRQVHSDPQSISIAKYGDKYYIDHRDLKCFMDARNTENYDDALSLIISAHDDPDMNVDKVSIIMGNNDLKALDGSTKEAMEESSITFEVY